MVKYEDPPYLRPQRRASHCNSLNHDNYEIRFLFSEDSSDFGYEIDKQRALFVTGGEDPSDYFLEKEGDDRLPHLIEEMKNRRT